jgi:hypothetical protein
MLTIVETLQFCHEFTLPTGWKKYVAGLAVGFFGLSFMAKSFACVFF